MSQRMVEAPIREALAVAGPGASAIDIACNEGWFAHRLLDWGAQRVVAVDSREMNIRRARLIRDHHGIGAERLDFIEADLFDLDPEQFGRFDVVNLLGILYHLENPIGAMRVARSLAKSLCVIESQVTRLNDPVELGEGKSAEASFALYREADTDTHFSPLAAMPGILSLIPNHAAIVEMARAVGFAEAEVVEPRAGSEEERLRSNRAVVLARC